MYNTQTTTTKTTLQAVIYEQGYSFASREKSRANGSNRTIRRYGATPIYSVAEGCADMTETAAAAIMHSAAACVDTVLRKVYAAEGNAHIWRLYAESKRIAPLAAENRAAYAAYAAEKHASSAMQEVKIRRYKVVNIGKLANGAPIRRRIECIPSAYLVDTAYSRDIIAVPVNSDAEDLLQVAQLAYLELVNIGLIKSYSDMAYYKSYVYSKIRRAIRAESKAAKALHANEYITFWDDEKSDLRLLVGADAEEYCRIERNGAIAVIRDYIAANLDKRSNAEGVLATFDMIASGATYRDVAAALGCSLYTVHSRIEQMRRICSTPAAVDMIRAIF